MLVKGRTSWAPLVATPGVGESVSESSFLLRRALTIRVDIAELECFHGSGWNRITLPTSISPRLPSGGHPKGFGANLRRKSIACHENVPRGQAAAAVHGVLMFGRLPSAREDFPTSKLSASYKLSNDEIGRRCFASVERWLTKDDPRRRSGLPNPTSHASWTDEEKWQLRSN